MGSCCSESYQRPTQFRHRLGRLPWRYRQAQPTFRKYHGAPKMGHRKDQCRPDRYRSRNSGSHRHSPGSSRTADESVRTDRPTIAQKDQGAITTSPQGGPATNNRGRELKLIIPSCDRKSTTVTDPTGCHRAKSHQARSSAGQRQRQVGVILGQSPMAELQQVV